MLAEWQVGQFLWSVIWFTLFFIWIWLLIGVFADIFRSHDLGGVAKTLWLLFVIFFPYLGVFVYLIARGGKMTEHAVADAQAREAASRSYIQSVSGGSDVASQIAKAAELREKGAITDEEFASLKARLLA